RLFQTLMRVVLERLALASIRRDADQYLLPESVLRVFRDPNLLLDRAHQLLVRLHLLFSDWILDPFLVAESFDVVEIVVAHRARHLFKRIDERSLHFDLRELVVLFARLRDVVQILFTLLGAYARVLFETVFDRTQRIDRIDTRDTVANECARQTIDDVAWRDTVHAFAHRLFFQLAHVFRLVTLDVLAVVKFHLLHDVDVLSLGFFEASHHRKHRGHFQSIWREVNVAQHFRLVQELVVNPLFLRDAQVVRHFHENDAILQRFRFAIARES